MGIIVNVPNRGLARRFAKAISKSKFGYCTTIEQWARGNFSHEPTNLTKAVYFSDGNFWIVDETKASNAEILQKVKNNAYSETRF